MKKSMIVVLSIILLASGCGGARWEDAAVDEQRHYVVKIQHLVEDSRIVRQQYMHPVDLESRAVAGFLSELAYMEPPGMIFRESQKTPVFQDKEIERLSPALAKALCSADENQRIAFISYNRGKGLIFEKNRKTKGLMFVDSEGQLNIAFSGINKEIPTDQKEAAGASELPDNALQIKQSATPLAADSDRIRENLQESGRPFPMWVKADLDTVKTEIKTAAPERTPDADLSPDIDIEKQREDIRSRLEYLKELYDEGLISRSEYDKKKGELIDAIE